MNKPFQYKYKGWGNAGDRRVCTYAPPQLDDRTENKCDVYSYARSYYTPEELDVKSDEKASRSTKTNICPNQRSAQSQYANIPQVRMDYGIPTYFG